MISLVLKVAPPLVVTGKRKWTNFVSAIRSVVEFAHSSTKFFGLRALGLARRALDF